MSALDKQVGGNHYKQFAIQPAEFCHKNKIPYLEATAIKYLCRWRDKGGMDDLDKAIHFIELLKEFETPQKYEYQTAGISVQVTKEEAQEWSKRLDRPLVGEKNVTSTL